MKQLIWSRPRPVSLSRWWVMKDYKQPSSHRKTYYSQISSYLSGFPDHDVVIVTIPDAQDVSSYTVASTGQRKFLYCLFKCAPSNNKTGQGSNIQTSLVLSAAISVVPVGGLWHRLCYFKATLAHHWLEQPFVPMEHLPKNGSKGGVNVYAEVFPIYI